MVRRKELQRSTMAVWIAVLCLLIPVASSALVSSSRVEQCIDDGSDLDCEQRLVITLAVNNGQSGTERVEALVETVSNEDGQVVHLQYPMRIALSKSTPIVRFPIHYIQTVNARPYEEVVYGGIVFDRCDDGALSPSPTCGWYEESGYAVPYSQGFCCECSLSDFLIDDLEGNRAGLTCSIVSGDPTSSAHCLRFHELWYDALGIGTSETHFDVTVTTSRWSTVTDQYEEDTVVVSPSAPIQTVNGVVARLLGDLSAFTQPLDLTSKLLFIPIRPDNHPRVQQGISKWVMVDRTGVELSGGVCDKIGVSFEAFRKQGEKCESFPGDCLKNQLEDLVESDELRIAQGRSPQHFLMSWGTFSWSTASEEEETYSLHMEVEGDTNSIVTLTFSADDIRFITNRSDGRINGVQVSSFESQSRDGALQVTVSNTGTIAADFTVAVEDCTHSIQPILSRTVSISAGHGDTLSFDVYSDTKLGAEHKCNVVLYDALGVRIDEFEARFETTNVNQSNGAQAGNNSATPGVVVQQGAEPFIVHDCQHFCVQWYDVLCLAAHECWEDVTVALLVLVILPLCLVLVLTFCCGAVYILRGPLCTLCCSCMKCATSGTIIGPILIGAADDSIRDRRRRSRIRKQERRIARAQQEALEMDFLEQQRRMEEIEFQRSIAMERRQRHGHRAQFV